MLVAFGASSGGLEAMTAVLHHLPAAYCMPTVLVLHQRANRESGVPAMLARHTHLVVCEPDDKQRIEEGYLYVAPPNYHLLVEREKIFGLSLDAPVNFSRPSIDLLLESAAFAYGPNMVACILSGANSDGAAGAVAVKKRHGRVYVQSPETASISVMPLAVTRLVEVDGMLSPAQLAQQLMTLQAKRISA